MCLTLARCLLFIEIHFTQIKLIELGALLRQLFSSFSIHQNHQEHLLNTDCYTTPLIIPSPLLLPPSTTSDSGDLGWALESAFLTIF